MHHLCLRSLLVPFLMLAVVVVAPGAVVPAFGNDCGTGVGPCSCGDTVTTNTKLDASDPVLRNTCSCTGIIVASGVTLDLGGTIRGSGSCTGVLIQDAADNVSIEHGRVVGFADGVRGENGGRNVTISGIQALDNVRGILLAGNGSNPNSNYVIKGNIVRGNEEFGILVIGQGDDLVQNNRADGNGEGISANSGGGGPILVLGNVATGNKDRGIDVDAFGGTVELNRADLNGDGGFHIGGQNLDVVRNFSLRNGGDGFFVECTGCRFDRNRSFYNEGFGIVDQSSFQDNVYTDNLCGGNRLGDSDPPELCH